MAVSKEKKGEILARLARIFADSVSVSFVNFHKLTVKNVQELRRAMRAAGSGYFVAKKTLIAKALESGKFTGAVPELKGEIAVAYLEKGGSDLTAPMREIYGFEKKFEKAVALVGGIFDGFFKSRDEMLVLAAIPPRQTLYAQFVNLVNSPLQRFAVVINEMSKKK
jgi:large subunit ribosomal protein L10